MMDNVKDNISNKFKKRVIHFLNSPTYNKRHVVNPWIDVNRFAGREPAPSGNLLNKKLNNIEVATNYLINMDVVDEKKLKYEDVINLSRPDNKNDAESVTTADKTDEKVTNHELELNVDVEELKDIDVENVSHSDNFKLLDSERLLLNIVNVNLKRKSNNNLYQVVDTKYETIADKTDEELSNLLLESWVAYLHEQYPHLYDLPL